MYIFTDCGDGSVAKRTKKVAIFIVGWIFLDGTAEGKQFFKRKSTFVSMIAEVQD